MSWPATTNRNPRGELEIGGVAVPELTRAYGTPLYVFDEVTLRQRARAIRDTFRAAYPHARVAYAGKAYLSPALMQILVDEDIGLDVVSGGEIYAGAIAGVPPARMILHGNNKSRDELAQAFDLGVGLIAVDNDLEIELLGDLARDRGADVDLLLRLNPGVDPHTHHKMRTGAMDSKFGLPVWDGQAERAVAAICGTRRLRLRGYHAHVGSQIFDATLVGQTLNVILEFASAIHTRFGLIPEVIVPGGGFGIADDASGDDVSVADWAATASATVIAACLQRGWPLPELVVEPGRAIVGPAGVAVYEVGARKAIPGARTYVSVDGGMSDNIRPALYGAEYSAELANRLPPDDQLEIVTIAGKYCESGDTLIGDIALPRLAAGDLLAVPMAGAYCLAMASNYNLAPRPAAVLVHDGEARLIRRRESFDDLLRAEIFEHRQRPAGGDAFLSAMKGSV
jgi:diaminopimelate decarboxylase